MDLSQANSQPKKSKWVCPCNGCKKAAVQERDRIIEIIKLKYEECPNIEEGVCYTWWKHEECEAYRDLLFILTKDEQYKEPVSKVRTELREAFDKMMSDPDSSELLKRLKSMEENGI